MSKRKTNPNQLSLFNPMSFLPFEDLDNESSFVDGLVRRAQTEERLHCAIDIVAWAKGEDYETAKKSYKNFKRLIKDEENFLPTKIKARAADGKMYKTDFIDDAQISILLARIPGKYKTKEQKTSGWIYVLHFKEHPDEYKIGISFDLERRMRSYRTENPPSSKMILDCSFYYDNCRVIESELHKILKEYQIRGEWFKLKTDQIEIIKQWLSSKPQKD